MKKHIYMKWGCLFFILLGFLITRFWKLTALPGGIHIDEAAAAYNAWCLANYGVDRYLKSWPVYFINFDGGQSALYAWLCAACIRLLGFSMWSVRLPGVLSSLLAVVFGMKIAERIFPENKYLPYAAGALAVICPYFIMASRFGLDCNLALGFSTVFLYFFIMAIEDGGTGYYVLAGLSGGVLLYTYALTYIFVPIFLIFSFFYTLWTKRFVFRKWLFMSIPLGILALPLVLVQLVNIFDWDEMQLGIFTITKMGNYRVSDFKEARWVYLLQALNSIFRSEGLDYNSVPGGYALYKISIVLFILGGISALAKLFVSVQKRRSKPVSFLVFWFLAIMAVEIHLIANANRINAIFIVTVLLIVEGISVLCSIKGWLRYLLPGAAGLIYLVSFAGFGKYYYEGQYTVETYPLIYFDNLVTEAVQFIEADGELRERKTYMTGDSTRFFVSALPSPYEIETVSDSSPNYGNYYFNASETVESNCNYIVSDVCDNYTEYKELLRQNGFQEIIYTGYSLFYLK